jgi:exodeoxyribonuclease V gamma subunit
MVLQGDRPEALAALLAAWLARHPLAPLEPEVLLVQSNGIAQWLRQTLAADPSAGGLGVAAGLDVQLPARFLWRAYRAVLGADAVPDRSPLDQAPLVWRLMRLLPALRDPHEMAPLTRYLASDADGRKRYALAGQLAGLYDQYQVYRADWLADWAAGRDQLQALHGATSLPDDQRWQAALWRALLADGHMDGEAGRAGVHQRFMAAMRALAESGARAPPGLPRRVVVFGIAALPAQTLQALAALSSHVQVMLFIHNPCRYYWADIVDGRELLRGAYRRLQHKPGAPAAFDAAALHAQAHPLLAAWGKLGRDYLHLVDGYDEPGRYRDLWRGVRVGKGEGRIDLFSDPTSGRDWPPRTLLAQLQDDILELRPLAETRAAWPPVDPARDKSLRLHCAHTPQREVEILHDQLLARFEADPTLQPREVIVMAPDIDAYAPHVEAVFGRLGKDDARYIPYSIADREQGRGEPLLAALDALLRLPDGRCAVSDVLDLLEVRSLRTRFGLDEDALPRIRRWVQGAAAHWGLDAAQRAAQGLAAAGDTGTWQFALQRLWLGYAAGAGGAFQGIAPYDGAAGLEAADLGSLAALIDALRESWQTLQRSAPPLQWAERLRALLARFFDVTGERERLLLQDLFDALEQWLADCAAARFDAPVPLAVARQAWLDALRAPGLHQRFLSGGVNFCTLLPMRSIPFRVVCLLGMSDGAFPRPPRRVDFDLMRGDRRPGDRAREGDDRYLLLEAVLSAREQLYISWIGRDARDDTPRMPSVLIGQLRDHVAAGWRLAGHEADDAALLAAITTEHPLQPFSRRYFYDSKNNGIDGLYSYAREWRAAHDVVLGAGLFPSPSGGGLRWGPAALAIDGPDSLMRRWPPSQPSPRGGRLKDPIPESALSVPGYSAPLTLTRLTAFFRQPAEAYFRERLAVRFPREDDDAADDEPFALQGLDGWALDADLRAALQPWCDAAPSIDAARAGLAAQIDAHVLRLRREGRLPLAGFGELAAQDLRERAARRFGHYLDALAAWPDEEPRSAQLHWHDEASGLTLQDALPPRRLAVPHRQHDDMTPVAPGMTAMTSPSCAAGASLKRSEVIPVIAAARVALADGRLHEGRGYAWQRIAPHWPVHLALQLAAGPTLTVLASESGKVTLPALNAVQARQHLAVLLSAYAAQARAPLPVALRAAFAFLTGDEKAARLAYEGTAQYPGERDRVPAAVRLWPDFDALLDGGGFAPCCEALYRPLVDALMPPGAEDAA